MTKTALLGRGIPIGKHAAGRAGGRHKFQNFVPGSRGFIEFNQTPAFGDRHGANAVIRSAGADQLQVG